MSRVIRHLAEDNLCAVLANNTGRIFEIQRNKSHPTTFVSMERNWRWYSLLKTMIQPPPIWITPHDNGWQVMREGAKRASAIAETQAKAFEIGNKIAKRERTEIYLTGRNGQIRERNSHGHDPRSRRG